MTPRQLAEALKLQVINEGTTFDKELSSGVTCDLLSWVMANGKKDGVWITVQTHLNIIAVASLLELACILIAGDPSLDSKTIEKAKEEGITLLTSKDNSYELSGRLFSLGIRSNEGKQ